MTTIPFTSEQFFDVFAHYNEAVWPAQIALNFAALLAIFITVRKRAFSDAAISGILGLLWIWMAIAYHWAFFRLINPGAPMFAALFFLQGALLLYAGMVRKALSFAFKHDIRTAIGGVLLLYGLVIYPLLGYQLGHAYPRSPTFGLPCPTTIFTFGMLVWTDRSVPAYILAIPVLWSVIGSTAALAFGVTEDFGLLISCVAALSIIVVQNRNLKKVARHNDTV
jgi:hypothetical protein